MTKLLQSIRSMWWLAETSKALAAAILTVCTGLHVEAWLVPRTVFY